MNSGDIVIKVHAQIMRTRQIPHQRAHELVQSTDQSWHWLWLLVAALLTALVGA